MNENNLTVFKKRLLHMTKIPASPSQIYRDIHGILL